MPIQLMHNNTFTLSPMYLYTAPSLLLKYHRLDLSDNISDPHTSLIECHEIKEVFVDRTTLRHV